MATTEKLKYATAAAITITLASLANNAARQSTEIDNSTDLYVDAQIALKIRLATGTPGNENRINVWFWDTVDSIRAGNAGAADAAYTMESPTNLKGPFIIWVTATGDNVAWEAPIPSVAAFFMGVMPQKWGIVVENKSNLALDADEGDHTKTFVGVHGQSV